MSYDIDLDDRDGPDEDEMRVGIDAPICRECGDPSRQVWANGLCSECDETNAICRDEWRYAR